MLLGKLRPTFRAESIYGCDFRSAYENGIRGLILDIDNTLVPHGAPIDSRSMAFLDALKAGGYRLFIVSNNHDERVEPFARASGIGYICDAGKPGAAAYLKAAELMGLKKEEIICVGDQLFTDIWGANSAGMKSLLTEPVDRSTDTVWIRLKRVLELPIKRLHNMEMSGNISQEKIWRNNI